MWRELLEAVVTKMTSVGLRPQPPCGADELGRTSRAVFGQLGIELPNEYRELLSIADGIDWNGLVFFASRSAPLDGFQDRHIEGILDANLGYRDDPDLARYLVLGEDGTVLFCTESGSARHVVLLKVGLTELGS